MADEFSIRLARVGDLEPIVSIYNEAVDMKSATADLEHVTVASREQWFAEHTSTNGEPLQHPLWVMVKETGEVAGWCSLSAYRPGRAALSKACEISYYVGKRHWGRGIATRLIAHALTEARDLGIRVLFSLILEVNTPSLRLMERAGFERWGFMPDVAELGDVVCGHVIMGRPV